MKKHISAFLILIIVTYILPCWMNGVYVTVPDSMKKQGFSGGIRFASGTGFRFDENGLDTSFYGHAECYLGVTMGATGYYMRQDSLLSEVCDCQWLGYVDSLPFEEEVYCTLNALEPGPAVYAGNDTTIYRYTKFVLSAFADSVDGRPILGYRWSVFGGEFYPTMFIEPGDTSHPYIIPHDTGFVEYGVYCFDDYGQSWFDFKTITVVDQPMVNNEMHWQITYSDNPQETPETRIVIGDTLTFEPADGVLDTLFFGRVEKQRALSVEAPGYYEYKKTVEEVCDCQFNGFDKDTAQILNCDVTLTKGPLASAGPNKTVHVETVVFLDASGSESYSPDRPITKYIWTVNWQKSSYYPFLSDRYAVNPTFMPMDTGTSVLNLVVEDDSGRSVPDEVIIRIIKDSIDIEESNLTNETPNLFIYPTPVSNFSVIHYNGNYKYISIYDIAGRLIRKFNYRPGKFLWDLYDLKKKPVPNGVYYARVFIDVKCVNSKPFIVLK